MTIDRIDEATNTTLKISGRLDTTTAPDLEEVINSGLSSVKELVLDFKELEYVSSAGLRVLLKAQKLMNKQGSMKLVSVNEMIMEVLEVTGFTDILTIE